LREVLCEVIGPAIGLATISSPFSGAGALRVVYAPQLLGQVTWTLKDATGKAFGEELYAAWQKPEGEITEVSYMFPRPA